MKTADMGENKELMEALQRLFDASSILASLAVNVGEYGAEKIVAMTASMTSQVTALAMVCGGKKDSKDISSEQIMFASILLGHMLTAAGGICYAMEFSPEIVLDAVESYQRMTGKKPDKFIAPGLAEMAREAALDADVPLMQFMASREKH